jgi:protein SCO1
MSNYSKAGLLVVTLVIPALIFMVLRLFGTNHYRVPFFHPLTDQEGHIIVSGSDTSFYRIDFQSRGEPGSKVLRQQSFYNRLTVLSYLPDDCDDTCKLVFEQLERIYGLRNEIKELGLVTIRTPTAFTTRIGREGWNYADFSPVVVDSVLYSVLKLRTDVKSHPFISPERRLVLVVYSGIIRGYYEGSEREEIERLMGEIRILNYGRNTE